MGISSECVLVWKALKPAAELHPLYRWFLIATLVIYVPGGLPLHLHLMLMHLTDSGNIGSYILYTHMMAQRRKVLRGKNRAD